MIDVSSIINDPDFVQDFQIIRVSGAFDSTGAFVKTREAPVALTGIVLPAKLDEVSSLPEGERRTGSVAIYSLTELRLASQEADLSGVYASEDEFIYAGDYYHLASMRYYAQCLLWYGVATLYQKDGA